MMMRHAFRGKTAFAGLAALFVLGCDSDDDKKSPTDTDTSAPSDTGDTADTSAPTFELIGEWSSDFGGYEVISATAWDTFDDADALVFGQKVTSFDNTANFVIVQNLPDAAFGANTYGRIIWTEPTASGFAYCAVAFGHETAAEAAAAPETGIDRTDLDTGCSGFAWTTLAPRK